MISLSKKPSVDSTNDPSIENIEIQTHSERNLSKDNNIDNELNLGHQAD
jgi:hypothetical protein